MGHSVRAVLRVAVLALVLLPTLAACAGEEGSAPAGEPGGSTSADTTPPPRQSPQVLTEADSGAAIALPTGGETSLRLSSDWVWEEPVVDGEAVQLVPVNYLQDPGFSEWVVMAVSPGEATITASGRAACAGQDGCGDGPQDFQVTITVAQ